MAQASIYLDKRRKNKNGMYPIKIRITHNRVRKYYSTGFHIDDQNSLDALFKPNVRGKKKTIQLTLIKIKSKAESIIESMTDFNFVQFETRFLSKVDNVDYRNVFSCMAMYRDKLKNENRVSTASSYDVTINSIKSFLKEKKRKSNLLFGDISPSWLQEYENWMVSSSKSQSTIGIYLRNLRAAYNVSIGKVPSLKEWYPFGKGKYTIPSSVNHKRALTFEQINQIVYYEFPEDSNAARYRDYFVFSYLCQGMNLKDIANLKWSNYNKKNKRLSFQRGKTRLKNKSAQSDIIIHLTDKAMEIINQRSNKDKSIENYIFPIYQAGMTEDLKLKASHQMVKNINRWIGKISESLDFGFKVTFYYARHSYATIIRDTGASIEYISNALGHNDIKTTQNYLGSFEDKEVKERNSKLIDKDFSKKTLKVSHKVN